MENGIDMPLTVTVHDFIKGKNSKEECIRVLMRRAFEHEFEPTFEDLI